LRNAGYFVGHVGKWHAGKFPQEHFDFGRSYSGTHWIKEKDGTQIHVTKKNENDALEFLATRPQDKPFCLTLNFSPRTRKTAIPNSFYRNQKAWRFITTSLFR
jgi:arylsulfatase A-like enzyme